MKKAPVELETTETREGLLEKIEDSVITDCLKSVMDQKLGYYPRIAKVTPVPSFGFKLK